MLLYIFDDIQCVLNPNDPVLTSLNACHRHFKINIFYNIKIVFVEQSDVLDTKDQICRKEIPGHKWKMPELTDLKEYRPSKIKVEEFMQTDLFTVQKDDIIELVAGMMDWRKISFTPVEDTKGNLVGLVDMRVILRYFIKGNQKTLFQCFIKCKKKT